MVYHDIIIYVYYIVYDITNDMVYHEIMSYICVIQRLRKVASMYRTIEIGTFSGPTRA